MPDSPSKPTPLDILQNVVLAIQTKIDGPDATKHLERIQKSAKKTSKALKSMIKQFTRLDKALKSKSFKAFVSQQAKTQKAIKKTVAESLKQNKSMKKQIDLTRQLGRTQRRALRAQGSLTGRAAASSAKVRGGSGLALPAFLSVAAITAATKSMIGFTTQLARARDMANALGGSFRRVTDNLPFKRDAEFFSRFAQQSFTFRFIGDTELKGLLAIRDVLVRKLGPAGEDVALRLTQSFKGSRDELSRFLTIGSQDVERAFAVFQTQDIEAFTTALSAARQKGDELTATANAIEQAWRDVQDSFERFVTDFVKEHQVDLKNVVQEVAQGVVDVINTFRRWGAEAKPVFDFILVRLSHFLEA